ncbi:MAG TPA: NADPH:quinone oxidoreductase family protein [Candidatus Acidoferrales bacterium]|nr:NADPH:quinone oxidoreductase family protein [Candidatus Acidoferrales bacterium]
MRAVVCREWGGPEKLTVNDVPPPPLRDGAVRIRVHAAGVNFADLLLIAGQYQEKPAFPFIPGAEAAGEVTEIGAGVNGLKVGDRVMALTGLGSFAEQVVVDAQRVLPIPDAMEFASAAAFPVAYGTSHGALEWRAHLQSGEWLLVTGAAGGVGLTAVEIGKAMGARVIACAGGTEKLAIAQQHGADHLIDYSKEDIRERVKAITGGHGADVIYDPVGGDAFDAALRCVAWGGRIIVIGFAAGRVSQIPANIVLVKNIDVIGFYWGSYQTHKPELLSSSFTQLFRWFKEGKLRPHISHNFPLEQAGDALRLLQQRKSTGKVVLVPSV